VSNDPTSGFTPDMPMEIAGGEQPPSLPLVSVDYWNKILVRQPSKIDGDAAHVSARIPLEWMEAISVLRDWQRNTFPSRAIWPTVSDFARSAIADFIETVSALKSASEKGQLPANASTGLIAAQMFNEQIEGELLARARAMTRAQSQAYKLAQAARDLMNRKEPVEAADMFATYVERAIAEREQSGSDFWERFHLNSLFRIPIALEDVTSLIQGGYITDTNIIGSVEHITELVEAGELELYTPELEEKIISLPLQFNTTTGDIINDNDRDTG
jgi:hypothetical protein